MKKVHLLLVPVALGLGVSLLGCTSSSGSAAAPASTATSSTPATTPPAGADALTGVWRMTALESGTDGELTTVPYAGQIVFSPTTVSVQAANPDTTAPDSAYTVQGYEAFYGDLAVDPAGGTWSVTVESALARDLVGQTLTRNFEVSDDGLVLTPVDASEGWRVTYERVS